MQKIIIIVLIILLIVLERKNNRLHNENSKFRNREVDSQIQIRTLSNENINLKNKYQKQPDMRSFEEKIEGKIKNAAFYEKKDFWDSISERVVFEKVKNILPDDYVLVPHISLRELFKHKTQNDGFRNVAYYHVDMVIFNKQFMTPLMGVEFDGDSHKEENQILRDAFKDALFSNAGIPLLRILDTGVTETQIYNRIKEDFNKAKLCKKCGHPMILRNSKFGNFYGCSQYGYGECDNKEKINAEWFDNKML